MAYIRIQAVGVKVDLNEGPTDGCFVYGFCEGPEGDIVGAVCKAMGPREGTAVGRHLLKVSSFFGTCTKMLGVGLFEVSLGQRRKEVHS